MFFFVSMGEVSICSLNVATRHSRVTIPLSKPLRPQGKADTLKEVNNTQTDAKLMMQMLTLHIDEL